MEIATIREALKTIKYPGFSRDIVSFGIIRDVQLEGGVVTVTAAVTSADESVPSQIQEAIEKTLGALAGIQSVNIQMSAEAHKEPLSAKNPKESLPPTLGGIKHIIAVASGKGGVGKSTVSVNLACALNKQLSAAGKPNAVGILDCDIYGPSIPLMLGINQRPLIEDNMILPPENFGVRAISMGLFIDADAPVVWRGPMIMKTIQQFSNQVQWGELEVLVVDLPPGTGDAQLSLVQTFPLDGAVVVTTPQTAAVSVATRGAKMFEKVNVPLLGVIENMSYFLNPANQEKEYLFGKGGGTEAARALETELLGNIPLENDIREGADRGIPIVIADERSEASQSFLKISESILAQLPLLSK